MRIHQLHDALVNLVPHLIGSHWAEFRGRNLDSKIESALVANVDDYRIWTSVSSEKMRDFFNRLLRRRKPDAHRRSGASALPAAPAKA
jgi:hypothetical protein